MMNNNQDNDEWGAAVDNGEKLGEIGINSFFVAKRAARRMIEFMERKRLIRKQEEEKARLEQATGV